MERFNLKKLNEVEGKEQYHAKISNGFASLENSDDEMGISLGNYWRENKNFGQRDYGLL
jgi:hypothetical protein